MRMQTHIYSNKMSYMFDGSALRPCALPVYGFGGVSNENTWFARHDKVNVYAQVDKIDFPCTRACFVGEQFFFCSGRIVFLESLEQV